LLIRRAIELRAALNLGISIGLEDLRADEFYTMLLLDEERERYERERSANGKPQ
jgi:hypothetical protein